MRLTSAQFSGSVVSSSLRPHGRQHARPPCPSPTPGACSDSCPSSSWCHSTISSSVAPFSSCLQSSPASGSFPVSQLFLDERKSHELYSLIPSPTSDRPVMSWNDSWEQAMLESWLEEHIAPRFARVICRICVVRVESELFKIYFFFFWSCCAAYSILVLKQGSNSCLLHSKGGVLTVGPPGKSPRV